MLSTYLLMDYQTGQVEYFNEHLPEVEAEIKANEEYLKSLPEAEEDSFTLADSSPAGSASLFGFTSKGGFQFLDGDILYNTEAGARLGHIAMVCGDRFFEIMPNSNKTTNKPALVAFEPQTTWGTWSNRYKWGNTYVLRRIPSYNNGNQNCRDISVNAAWYAKAHYINGGGQNIKYYFAASSSSAEWANCVSIVYRSYKDGADFNYNLSYVSQGTTYYYNPNGDVLTPFDIFYNRVANGFSAIKKF